MNPQMNPQGSDSRARGWSLDDIKRLIDLHRYSGLFGSGWAQFMANQRNTSAAELPANATPDPLRRQSPIPPSTKAAGSSTLGVSGPSAPNDNASQTRAGVRPVHGPQGASTATPNSPIDPSRTDVFRRGPDGKLHPIPGWRTTGPFDLGTWSHEFNWKGVARDLTNIGLHAAGFMGGAEPVIEALGLSRILDKRVPGTIDAHHPHSMFLGGRPDQEKYELIKPSHGELHADLRRALKGPGVPPVGGRGGSRADWEEFFRTNPEAREKAIEILRRVTREHDIKRGTSIFPALEKELRIVRPSPKPPPLPK